MKIGRSILGMATEQMSSAIYFGLAVDGPLFPTKRTVTDRLRNCVKLTYIAVNPESNARNIYTGNKSSDPDHQGKLRVRI